MISVVDTALLSNITSILIFRLSNATASSEEVLRLCTECEDDYEWQVDSQFRSEYSSSRVKEN
jgi:hypothetical protein